MTDEDSSQSIPQMTKEEAAEYFLTEGFLGLPEGARKITKAAILKNVKVTALDTSAALDLPHRRLISKKPYVIKKEEDLVNIVASLCTSGTKLLSPLLYLLLKAPNEVLGGGAVAGFLQFMDTFKEGRPYMEKWLQGNPDPLDFTVTEITAQMLNETISTETRFLTSRLSQMILKDQMFHMRKTYTKGEARVVVTNQEILEVLQEHRCYGMMSATEEKTHRKIVDEENAKRRATAPKPGPKRT